MKCWNSAFNNAQGVWNTQVGRALDTLRERENERQDETQFSTKIDGFLNFQRPWCIGNKYDLTLTLT
jgi:hypothetical protein